MSSAGLVARLLAPADEGHWDRLAAQHGCIFDSLRWTGQFGPDVLRLGIYDAGGNLQGGFCADNLHKYGLRLIRNPPYTPQVGPFYEPRASNPAARTDEQRAVVEAMAAYLQSSGAAVIGLGLSLGITDCLPFRWRDWKVIPHYTYRIDLSQSEEALLAAIAPRQRSSIRKAAKDGVAIEWTADTHDLRMLVAKTFARQNVTVSRDAMDAVLASYPPGQGSFCVIARAEGLPISGCYLVHDSKTAYVLMSGYDSARGHHGAGALAKWHAILKAREMGLEVFDFEGSVIPPIEEFNRSFGGVLTPIFSVYRAWLPLEMVLKLVRRNTF